MCSTGCAGEHHLDFPAMPGLTTTAAAAEHLLSTEVHQINDIKIFLQEWFGWVVIHNSFWWLQTEPVAGDS